MELTDKKTKLRFEGRDKLIWESDNPEHLIIEYSTFTQGDDYGDHVGIIPKKDVYINRINNNLFRHLEENSVLTHHLGMLNDRETVVKKLDIIPIEIYVRNIAAGTLVERLGVPEGTRFEAPVLEYYFKRHDLMSNPMINSSHALAMKLCTAKDLDTMNYNAFRINRILQHYLSKQNILLVDFKIEFGKSHNRIILADEISPDTCRFWDSITGEKLDKDRFRCNLGDVEEAYEEICKRLMRA